MFSCKPSLPAACCRIVASVTALASAWLMSAAITVALGTAWCSSSSRFAKTVLDQKVTPVALVPGCSRLATSRRSSGLPSTAKTIGIVVLVAALAASDFGIAAGENHVHPLANQIERKPGKSLVTIFGGAIVDCDILAFDKTGLLEALTQSGEIGRRAVRRGAAEIAEHRHGGVFGRLLRARGERPACSSPAGQRYEVPPSHGFPIPKTTSGEARYITGRTAGPPLGRGFIQLRRKLGVERIIARIDVIDRRDRDRFGAVLDAESLPDRARIRAGSAG